MATIMSTPSSRISSPARDAAVSELDSTSFTMISTAYDLSPSMMPSATSFLMPARMNSLASPKPASGPVSGAVKPILTVPSPPPPPNLAALPRTGGRRRGGCRRRCRSVPTSRPVPRVRVDRRVGAARRGVAAPSSSSAARRKERREPRPPPPSDQDVPAAVDRPCRPALVLIRSSCSPSCDCCFDRRVWPSHSVDACRLASVISLGSRLTRSSDSARSSPIAGRGSTQVCRSWRPDRRRAPGRLRRSRRARRRRRDAGLSEPARPGR